MTVDIENLRQDVIDAARLYRYNPEFDVSQRFGDYVTLIESLDALDEAEEPNPWDLLAEFMESDQYEDNDDLVEKIDKALKWYRSRA